MKYYAVAHVAHIQNNEIRKIIEIYRRDWDKKHKVVKMQ